MSWPFPQLVEPLAHDRPENGVPHGGEAEREQIGRGGVGRGLGGIGQPVRRGEMGLRHAHPGRGCVHPRDEGIQSGAVGVREGICRIRPRRQQQRLQQLTYREHVPWVQRRVSPPYFQA